MVFSKATSNGRKGFLKVFFWAICWFLKSAEFNFFFLIKYGKNIEIWNPRSYFAQPISLSGSWVPKNQVFGIITSSSKRVCLPMRQMCTISCSAAGSQPNTKLTQLRTFLILIFLVEKLNLSKDNSLWNQHVLSTYKKILK